MPTYDLLIKGGFLVDPANARRGQFDLAVKDGQVAAVEQDINPEKAIRVYDARGRLLLPGLIDTHVHLTPAMRSAGFHMLAKAGVTTALDCAGPVEVVLEGMAQKGCGINVAVLNRVTPKGSLSSENPPAREVKDYVEKSLSDGAIGIKLIGGHMPLTPETTATAIEAANQARGYAAFHCGTTKNGSNLNGFMEAVELAGDNSLQICHINAYCRGLTLGSPVEETMKALAILEANPHLVSESHMGPFNSCWARLNDRGIPVSHVTRTCLESGGYGLDSESILQAAREGYMRVQRAQPSDIVYLQADEGAAFLEEVNFETMVSFPVNRRSTAFLCATEKGAGGDFMVTALSTDGGAIPRNFLLSHGLCLVRFGALSLDEFVLKTAWAPARMLGLENKGHLKPGADADLVVADRANHEALLTVSGGRVIMSGGVVVGRGGVILCTPSGSKALKEKGVEHQVVDLENSLFYNAPAGMPRLGV